MRLKCKSIFILIALPIFLFGCEGKKNESSSTTREKLSLVLYQDNTYSRLLRCSAGTTGIECGDQSDETIPTFGGIQMFKGLSKAPMSQIEKLADGCYEESDFKGEASVFLSNPSVDDCKFSARLYKGSNTSVPPMEQWTDPFRGGTFSGLFPYLNTYTLDIVNVGGTGACSRTLLYQERPSYDQDTGTFILGEGSLSISSLFSLAVDPEMNSITTAAKSSDFAFKWVPALNTEELIADGVTDDSIETLLNEHLGDFVLLSVKDSYGHSILCRQKDSHVGTITVPASMMQQFSGATKFVISRYKIKHLDLTADQELVLNMRVGMFTDNTDVYGQVSGGFSVWIE